MKRKISIAFFAVLCCICFSALAVIKADTTVVIESKADLTIRGERVLSPFNVVMTDTNVTVNGREITNVKNMVLKMEIPEKPGIETPAYINWLTVKVMSQAESLLVAGRRPEEIRQFMQGWLEAHVRESKSVSLIVGKWGFHLRHSSWPEGREVGLPVPDRIREPIDLKKSLKSIFDGLCSNLRSNRVIRIEGGAIISKPGSDGAK